MVARGEEPKCASRGGLGRSREHMQPLKEKQKQCGLHSLHREIILQSIKHRQLHSIIFMVAQIQLGLTA